MAFSWRVEPIVLWPRTQAPPAGGSGDPEAIRRRGEALAKGGQDSMNVRWNAHLAAINATGIGVYYGSSSAFHGMTAQQRQQWIARTHTPGTTPGAPQVSSCIGWAMEHVEAAYVAAGMQDRWREVEKTVSTNDFKGTVLAQELQKDGWQAVYFNPDTKRPPDRDGEHPTTAKTVQRGEPYYGINVDHQVVNYNRTRPGDPADATGVDRLKQVPFFFGVARGGMHTFVGQNGRVNEFHFDRMPNDRGAITETPLESFGWNSGVVMVPPGSWPSR